MVEPRTVVVVEGVSDQHAVHALARRLGRDLERERVQVAVLGGAHAIGRFLALVGPRVRVVGLCDAGEEHVFRRALDGRDAAVFVCDRDLEDELIRALGVKTIERLLAERGELASFRTMQKQPEWRGRPPVDQLRRFMGNASRKIRYAAVLVDELPRDRIPAPLERLLAHV